MFNSTHTLTGLAIARTGLDKWAPRAAITAVIAANLPDIDIVTDFIGFPSYLELHRGITHSFIGIPFLSLALAAAMYVFTGTFWRTYAIALIAMATHPALDFANNYGLRPFLPFDGTWYYGDTLFIIDPIIDGILLTGILAGRFFRRFRRAITLSAIAIAGLYIANQVGARNEARAHLETFTAEISGFERSAVLPRMLAPWSWDGVVETNDSIFKVGIDAAGSGVGQELARMPKIRERHQSELISRAAAAHSASVFLGFARFPITRIQTLPQGYRVTFLDFRYYNEANHTALAARVELDRSFNVVNESMSFSETLD